MTKKLVLPGMLAVAALVALAPGAAANHDPASCTADAALTIVSLTVYKLVWENLEWPGDAVQHAVDFVAHPSYLPSYPDRVVSCL